jgi:class 3 adenylate cyclase
LVKSLDPTELASLLSGYLEGMTEIVFAHEGTVAKIIGDAIHVLFGAPAEQPDAAKRAIACALALDSRADEYRRRARARVHRPPGRRSQAARQERAAAGLRAACGGSSGKSGGKNLCRSLR